MPKKPNACCPGCGACISFRKFVSLNNLSAANCDYCNTRMEITNRNSNTLIAGISGCIAVSCIISSTWYGVCRYNSVFGGLLSGLGIAVLLIVCVCRHAYTHSKFNKINTVGLQGYQAART